MEDLSLARVCSGSAGVCRGRISFLLGSGIDENSPQIVLMSIHALLPLGGYEHGG